MSCITYLHSQSKKKGRDNVIKNHRSVSQMALEFDALACDLVRKRDFNLYEAIRVSIEDGATPQSIERELQRKYNNHAVTISLAICAAYHIARVKGVGDGN